MPATSDLLFQKMNPPRIGVNTVWRNRLIALLQEYQSKKLTLLTAPTGYGKTVLVSQFATISDMPVVWYQLDEFDNDLTVFIRYLVASISQQVSQYGKQTLNYIDKNGDTSIRAIAALITNELEARAKSGLIIVLDDYHLISESLINDFVELLIQYLPDKIHLIVSSRYVLPFNLARLRAHGLVHEITYNELRFRKDEIRQLFEFDAPGGKLESMIDKYYSQTDGWAVALSLVGAASFRKGEQLELPAKWESREAVYAYFAEEVFRRLPDDIRKFLISTSVLDILTPDICNVLTERQDSEEVLKHILDQNLFLMRIEGEAAAYQYHHLFRDFLQAYLGGEKNVLFARVGAYFAENGQIEQAVENFLIAEDYRNAIKEIEKIAVNMVKSGKWRTTDRWIRKMPESEVNGSPWCQLLKGDIYNNNGLWDEALAKIDAALVMFREQNNETALLDGRFQKAVVLRRAGKLSESISVLDDALNDARELPVKKWYDIVLEKVNTLLWLGELRAAAETLANTLLYAEKYDEPGLYALFLEHLGATYYAIGEYYTAVEYFNKANIVYSQCDNSLSEFESERYSQTTTLAKIYRDWGELEKAHDLLDEEIKTLERLGLIDELPRAYHEMALIYFDLGDLENSEAYFKHAGKLYEKLERKDFQWTWYLALYGNILMVSGHVEQGKSLMFKAVEFAKNNSELNLAVCEVIGCVAYFDGENSRGGIELLEHALAVGRKVGAKNLICQCCWILSNVYAKLGAPEKAMTYAGECFALAAPENNIQIFVSYGELSVPILKLGMELGIEQEFLDRAVLRLGYRAEGMLLELCQNSSPDIKGRAEKLLSEIKKSSMILDKAIEENARIYVRCFGGFAVLGKGEAIPVKWKTEKAMAVLAYFVSRPDKTIAKDRILEDIWPELNPRKTSTWLHTYIYQIREILKNFGITDGLVYENKGYRLKMKGIGSDVRDFSRLINAGEAEKTQTIAAQKLEEAVALCRGEYMEGCYEQWALDERAQLEKRYIAARERLAEIYIENKEYGKATEHLRGVLEKDPLSERTHEMLINIFELVGDRISALNQYETYQNILKNELGIQPPKEMREIYTRIKKEK